MIGLGSLGAAGLTAFAYTDAMKASTPAQAVAFPAEVPAPMNGPRGSSTTTTSYSASYAPQIHTRSHGS